MKRQSRNFMVACVITAPWNTEIYFAPVPACPLQYLELKEDNCYRKFSWVTISSSHFMITFASTSSSFNLILIHTTAIRFYGLRSTNNPVDLLDICKNQLNS